MLTISGIDVFRGETQVLWDVSLEVQSGERVAILGSNGAGKSTVLAAVTGLVPAQRGDILFKGRSLLGEKPYQITQLGVALVPEGRRIYRDMSVWENLEMGAYPKRGRYAMERTREYVLQLFPILRERNRQRAGTLSGGEQQMVAIGRALMSRPELLLVDELSLGLAPLLTKEIYRALDALAEGITILLVEQNVELALKHSQRAYVLESGHITRSGGSEELIQDMDIRRAYLGM